MNSDLTLRQINKKDYEAIGKIISDTWGYEKFCSPKIAKKIGKIYLLSCLCE